MFASGPNYQKLKTNLRLAVNRLKLLEKKKTELALKARKEIADYIGDGKVERARIRVEHIIREDYIVEAMEIVEMYCDLLLARFGLLQQMKELDEGLAEAISSLIWVAPRLQTDAAELKLIGDQLTTKYGKPYGLACAENSVGTVSPKLMQKMSVHAPPKILIEKYLIEIANNYNVAYEPDQKVLAEAQVAENLIELGEDGRNNLDSNSGGGRGGGAGGGGGGNLVNPGAPPAPGFHYPYRATEPGPDIDTPPKPFEYPTYPHLPDEPKVPLGSPTYPDQFSPMNIPPPGTFGPQGGYPGAPHPGFAQPQPPNDKELNFNYKDDSKPKPAPRGKLSPGNGGEIDFPELPDLPAVPSSNPSDSDVGRQSKNSKPKTNNVSKDDDIDFDDLSRRFEDLKKRK